jgi:signal transduction histidine kinase
VETPTLLIVADEPEFGRQLTARWQTEPRVPALTQVSSDLWNPASASAYDLLILGPLAPHRASSLLESLGAAGVAVLTVAENEREVSEVQSCHPAGLVLLRQNDWVSVVVVVAGQILRRTAAQRRAEAAENIARVLQRRAALGRYMLEMRPALNNALTSALGNADLLLLESTGLRGEALDHVRTLHRMILRMNEMVQRFSSLASELQLIEKPSQSETEEEIPGLLAGAQTQGELL